MHHCNICGKCISDFDHHCYFINTCVGKGNLGWFLFMILILMTDFIWSSITSLEMIQANTLEISSISKNVFAFISTLMLLFLSPFFYLNISNYLNSTTVHKEFSKKKSKYEFFEGRKSILLEQNLVLTSR